MKVNVASIIYFPPSERRVNSLERGAGEGGFAGRGGRGWLKGGKLEVEDVASRVVNVISNPRNYV